MAGMTNTHESDCLQHMTGDSAFPFSTNLFLCFFTQDPTETGSLTNETDYGGARTAITYKAAATGQALNNEIASIDTTGWDGIQITDFGLSKGSVRGTDALNWFGQLSAPINYTPGDILTVAADALPVRFYDSPAGTSAGTKVTVAGSNLWLDHSLGTGVAWTVAAADISLHSAAPAIDGNEFASTGGYARVTFTAGSVSAGSGDFQKLSHTNPLNFPNIIAPNTNYRSWGMYQGSTLVFIRDQGSDIPVSAGSSIDATANTLEVAVN